ncbi:LOW QUALITY PROTEIN: uncharacterized protein LOC124261811 [Haliotis rubra]|uniref:LOW QUALITY PROTEIN: uncharacterized protein LOC124261811 n=1 Tax=Haliotis rubra TaxID=36100 RepID=UPI001EE5C21B|nr:LOW QUALITY PROTEIN: uncharacterized protein LOC124261811 [Haliotis rubra]
MRDFSNQYCKHLDDNQTPEVTQMMAQFSYWGYDGDTKREIFGFIADATDKTEEVEVWTNRQQLNKLNVTAGALFKGQDLPYPPSYISDAKTGIARAYFKLSGPTLGSEDDEFPCDEAVDPENPKEMVQCSFTKNDISRLNEGERLKLTFHVSSGGYRRLTGSRTAATQHYTGTQATSTVSFHLDMIKPVNNDPNDAFQVHPEFTKQPINIKWDGWRDLQSGLDKYTWEAFKLEPSPDGSLMEVDKLRPVVHRQVDHTDPISYPLPYAPDRPGMYSFVLEAADKANNSVYMRRFALYDKESSVTTDPDHALYISSAVQDHGFQWMTDASTPLVTNWQDHFLNYVHESGKFLNSILPFRVKVVEDPPIYKEVPHTNDDHYGRRTRDAIPNVRGIVRFEWTHAVNKSGGRALHTPVDWNEISGLNTTNQTTVAGVTSGTTVTVWVRAWDILGNRKVDSTSVTYDFTEPQFTLMAFHKMKNPTFPSVPGKKKRFLRVTAQDAESGLDYLEVKVFSKEDGSLLRTNNVSIPSIHPLYCTDRVHDCYCPNALNVCYKRINKVYISNCWLMVAKNALATAQVRLQVRVVNRAGLKTSTHEEQVVTKLLELNGTTTYLPPSNLRTKRLSSTSIRVMWDHAPACHERTVILVSYQSDSGPVHEVSVPKDDTSYDLTGLDPDKKYKVMVSAGYGAQRSEDNVNVVAKSADDRATETLGAGAVAGIVIVILIVVAVAGVGFFLWRTGRMQKLIRGRQKRYGEPEAFVTGTTTNNIRPPKNTACYDNMMYTPEDDIYLYGGMSFTTNQPGYMSKDQLSLLEEIQTGRLHEFSRLLTRLAKDTGWQKVLTGTPDEESSLLMMAKINFAATKVGEHRNVLKFIGAVVDNDALGPVLVLEYCENGPLDKWLTSRRDKVNLEVLEQIQTFALGIARGMAYLVGKEIVHRKLAARNCLLTSTNEVMVSGFGPSRMEDASADDASKGQKLYFVTRRPAPRQIRMETNDKSRLRSNPVKWTAPECLQSLNDATEKSDIWSFGITMWEILSMGKIPYGEMRSRDLPTQLMNGYRLSKPEYAEDVHYTLMQSCWKERPEARTTFADAVGKLEASFGLRPTSGMMYYYSK